MRYHPGTLVLRYGSKGNYDTAEVFEIIEDVEANLIESMHAKTGDSNCIRCWLNDTGMCGPCWEEKYDKAEDEALNEDERVCTVCKKSVGPLPPEAKNGNHLVCEVAKQTGDGVQLHWAGVVYRERKLRRRERYAWAGIASVCAVLGAVLGWKARR